MKGQKTIRRPVVVIAILLVAAAVLLVALLSWLDLPAGETGVDDAANVAADLAADFH